MDKRADTRGTRGRIRQRARGLLAMALAGALVVVGAAPARAEVLTFDRAVKLARERAVEVVEASGSLRAAGGELIGAKRMPLGNPYLEVQFDRGTQQKELQALGFLYFPLEIFGQRGARIDEAERLITWRKLSLHGAQVAATGQVVQSWGDATTALAELEQARSGESTAAREAEYYRQRLEAADTTVYERSLAEAELARWHQIRVEAELSLIRARAELSQLVGLRTVEPPPDAGAFPPSLRGAWDEAHVASVLAKSPMLQQLQGRRSYFAASAERYRAERAIPLSFELIGGKGATDEARYGAGFVVGFPTFQRYQGEIAKAEAERATAGALADRYRAVLEGKIRAAHSIYTAARKTVDEIDRTAIPAMERAVAAAAEAQKLGKVELYRVLVMRRDLATSRTRRLDLMRVMWRAYGELILWTGEDP